MNQVLSYKFTNDRCQWPSWMNQLVEHEKIKFDIDRRHYILINQYGTTLFLREGDTIKLEQFIYQ